MIARRIFDFPEMAWRNPFAELQRMRREMDFLAGNLMGRPMARRVHANVFPAVNITEDENSYYVRAELPGITSEDLDIQAAGNSLTLSGSRKIAAEEGVKYHRREREAGSFSRIIHLPDDADIDKISANLANGILTVSIEKSEKRKPRQIAVN